MTATLFKFSLIGIEMKRFVRSMDTYHVWELMLHTLRQQTELIWLTSELIWGIMGAITPVSFKGGTNLCHSLQDKILVLIS